MEDSTGLEKLLKELEYEIRLRQRSGTIMNISLLNIIHGVASNVPNYILFVLGKQKRGKEVFKKMILFDLVRLSIAWIYYERLHQVTVDDFTFQVDVSQLEADIDEMVNRKGV